MAGIIAYLRGCNGAAMRPCFGAKALSKNAHASRRTGDAVIAS
jgi:hypothetical protein